jgi:hypothetical protein
MVRPLAATKWLVNLGGIGYGALERLGREVGAYRATILNGSAWHLRLVLYAWKGSGAAGQCGLAVSRAARRAAP